MIKIIKNKYVVNAIWLFLEKILTIASGFFITIYTARYLGPEKMGIITLIISVLSILTPISQIGTLQTIFDKTIKKQSKGFVILVSSRKYVLAIFCLLAPIPLLYLWRQGLLIENLELTISILFYIFFLSYDRYIPFFNASLDSKINVIATNVGLILSHACRFFLVYFSFSFVFFGIPFLIISMVPFLVRRYYFNKKSEEESLSKFEKKIIKNKQKTINKFILRSGVPLAISSLSVMMYVKIGQIFISSEVGNFELGIYNAASTLGQLWSVFPVTIITIVLTKLFKFDEKSKLNGASILFFILIVINFLFVLFIWFFEFEIIMFTFGVDYIKSAGGVFLLSIATFFSILGVLSYRVIVNLNGYNYLMKKMFVVMLFNIVLSYFLIGRLGLDGAYYSIIITEILSLTLFNYFYKDNLIFVMQKKSLNVLFLYTNLPVLFKLK